MRCLLGFLFGAGYTANRVFRVTFLLLILFIAFCLYQMSKPLGHSRGGSWTVSSRSMIQAVSHGPKRFCDDLVFIFVHDVTHVPCL